MDLGASFHERHPVNFGDHRWNGAKVNLVVPKWKKQGTLYMMQVFEDETNVVITVKGVGFSMHLYT